MPWKEVRQAVWKDEIYGEYITGMLPKESSVEFVTKRVWVEPENISYAVNHSAFRRQEIVDLYRYMSKKLGKKAMVKRVIRD